MIAHSPHPGRLRSPAVSSLVSRASAGVQLFGGVGLLFAPDTLLPALAPGFPTQAAWLGQLLGAAWLGMAALNWLQRGSLLGGSYGRPVVLANAALYFVSALSLLRALAGNGGAPALWVICVPMLLLGLAYWALLLSGPFDTLE